MTLTFTNESDSVIVVIDEDGIENACLEMFEGGKWGIVEIYHGCYFDERHLPKITEKLKELNSK